MTSGRLTSLWLSPSQSQKDGPPLLTWTSLSLLCGLWHWVLLDNFFFPQSAGLLHLPFGVGGTSGFSLLLHSFFFSLQRDSLLFSTTPQPQLKGSPFSLPPSPKLTFYSKLIIILLETSPIPGVTGILARSLTLTSNSHYFLLPPACFEWDLTPGIKGACYGYVKIISSHWAVLMVSICPSLSDKF